MPLSKLGAIRRYFETDGGRKLTIIEIKALTIEDREELAPLCAAELSETLEGEKK